MDINMELKRFSNFINSIDGEEFDNMLESAGIDQVKSCEDFNMVYYSDMSYLNNINLEKGLRYS